MIDIKKNIPCLKDGFKGPGWYLTDSDYETTVYQLLDKEQEICDSVDGPTVFTFVKSLAPNNNFIILFFIKNGKIHREDGPAKISIKVSELGFCKKLLQIKTLEEGFKKVKSLSEKNDYFLEGLERTKEAHERVIRSKSIRERLKNL